MTFDELLIDLKACKDAREWAKGKTIDEVVDTCYRGDWLLWLAQKVGMDIRLLTLAKGHCAATVLHLMKDERSRKAVEVAIAFGEGRASEDELRAAAYAAAYAHAAACSAYAHAAACSADAYSCSADAASAARQKNQKETADICRKYIGEELKKLVKEKL